jgi:hypothetical protein
MIVDKKKRVKSKLEIDLSGPEGNAFVLMGIAQRWAKELGLDSKAVIADMMSGDYEHLLSVMEKHFGDHIIMYR